MSSVVISGDTSGAITLTVPTVAGTYTQTHPAASGTVMVSGNMPAFSAYSSSTQTPISNQTWTKVQCGTKEYDTASCYDNTTNYRFTPNVAGYYNITGFVRFGVGTSMTRLIVGIWKNGAEYRRPIEPSFVVGTMGTTVQFGGSCQVYMNGTTDYVELYGYATATGTLSFLNDGNPAYSCSFSGILVRTA
jgi:hypothetical protein